MNEGNKTTDPSKAKSAAGGDTKPAGAAAETRLRRVPVDLAIAGGAVATASGGVAATPYPPTQEFYSILQRAYDHFNDRLFEGGLPHCLLTVQRETNTMGFFSARRWVRNPTGESVHELAMNPAYFACLPLIELFQTLVHEQVHVWQEEFGSPSRNRYHNSEWAAKMEGVGLMPSSTGRPGGRRTGQKVSDYPIPDGLFEQACIELLEAPAGFALPMVDRVPAPGLPSSERPLGLSLSITHLADDDLDDAGESPNVPEAFGILSASLDTVIPGIADNEEIRQAALKKRKTKYQCPYCGTNVWGRPGLNVICGDCDIAFVAVGPEEGGFVGRVRTPH